MIDRTEEGIKTVASLLINRVAEIEASAHSGLAYRGMFLKFSGDIRSQEILAVALIEAGANSKTVYTALTSI